MTQDSTDPVVKRPSPLRGVVVAVAVLLIFPATRGLVTSLLGILVAAAVGAFLMGAALTSTRIRR